MKLFTAKLKPGNTGGVLGYKLIHFLNQEVLNSETWSVSKEEAEFKNNDSSRELVQITIHNNIWNVIADGNLIWIDADDWNESSSDYLIEVD